MNRHLSTLVLSVLLASCTGQAAVLQSNAAFGCKMSPAKLQDDADRVCQGAIDAMENRLTPEEQQNPLNNEIFTWYGHAADARMFEQNAPTTMNLPVPIEMPNGDVAAEVSCEINTKHHSVTYARVTQGPKTQAQADFLHSLGACEE